MDGWMCLWGRCVALRSAGWTMDGALKGHGLAWPGEIVRMVNIV